MKRQAYEGSPGPESKQRVLLLGVACEIERAGTAAYLSARRHGERGDFILKAIGDRMTDLTQQFGEELVHNALALIAANRCKTLGELEYATMIDHPTSFT